MVFEMVSLDPATLAIVKLALLAIAGMVLYLYATSRVNAYVRKNNIPLEKARELVNATRVIVLLLVLFAALNILGAVANIALSTSILGAVIILVSQSFLSSFVSGLYLVASRSFGYGDRIQVGDYIGDVLDIGLISTRIKTPNNEVVTIPNSIFLTTEVKNYDIAGSEKVVEMEDIGVSYSSDLRKAKALVLEVIKEYAREEPHLLADPEPRVTTSAFGDSSINLKVKFYVDDVRLRGAIASEIRDRVKEAFEREGIEIPFPQRVVRMEK
ncbi:MAG: mechanosensitive ion channel family protein [Euryarchaeota archaeon]|nr:mechanosensitive ion channel family protein [Euryarchaeota archaeon]